MSDYSLGIKELDEAIGGIRKGSNIMLIGPPMSQKEVILYNIMYHGTAIIVEIIDCITKSIGVAASETESIKIVSSPADLTGIGVRIGQVFEDFLIKKNIRKIQLHINSLSTILMYSNIQTVFRFMHVFQGASRKLEPWEYL